MTSLLTQQSQPYDSSLKSLLEGQAADIIPHLLTKAEFREELNAEILKPPLRADRVYRIWYKRKLRILHIELEASSDTDIAYRLLEYNSILLKKHKVPIISMVIYPFKTTLPQSPLHVVDEDGDILIFHFRVIAMWTLSAKYFVENHIISMYPLLPTMLNATYEVLVQGIEEMKIYYHEHRRLLAERLLWFYTFLRRSDMVSQEDKQRVEAKMGDFNSLLEENPFVQKKAAEAKEEGKAEGLIEGLAEGEAKGRAKGLAEGKVEGKAEGTVEALQQAVLEIVKGRFPPLAELARQEVVEVKEPSTLLLLVKQVSIARDEEIARFILSTLAA